jgi:hypothetical protein
MGAYCWRGLDQTGVLLRLPTKGTMWSRALEFSSSTKRISLTRSAAETER